MSTPTSSGSSQKLCFSHHKIFTRNLTMTFSAVSKLFSANAGWVWTCFSDSLPLFHQAVEARKRGRNVFHLQFLNWKETGQTPSPDTVVEIFGRLQTHQQSCGNPTVVIHCRWGNIDYIKSYFDMSHRYRYIWTMKSVSYWSSRKSAPTRKELSRHWTDHTLSVWSMVCGLQLLCNRVWIMKNVGPMGNRLTWLTLTCKVTTSKIPLAQVQQIFFRNWKCQFINLCRRKDRGFG